MNKKKQMLAAGRTDLGSLIQKYLVPRLLQFELSEERQQIFPSSETEIPSAQAEVMFSFLLQLDKPVGDLDQANLLQLYNFLVADEPNPYRQSPLEPLTSTHAPLDPWMVPRAIERFFEWVQSPSFAEMHAVEQMTVAQIRLYEIYPFAKYSGITVSAFSYYFLVADGYLVPLYETRELPEFHQALKQAFAFSTEDLVRFNVRACERAYEYVLKHLRGPCL
ncbi:Fic family protein [Acidobacteria bacterium AH-259-G07]|nr:Fic family protein [Acidobacteria bacterium AH-259-G07]